MGKVPSRLHENPNPMVTPGMPQKSYLYAITGGEGAGASSATAMASCRSAPPLDPVPLRLLKRWIEAGAPGPGEAAGDAGAGNGEDMDGGT